MSQEAIEFKARWDADSSLEAWFPITAERLAFLEKLCKERGEEIVALRQSIRDIRESASLVKSEIAKINSMLEKAEQ